MNRKNADEVLAAIEALPDSWHSGPLNPKALRAIASYVGTKPLLHSLETGSGHSTLLLSHLSQDHKVFSIAGPDTDYLRRYQSSPILNRATVEFIEGPTQRTLPGFRFESPLQLALIDGPHSYPFPDLEYYHIYPHLETGALLIVDDIHVPTISHLFTFLREDAMFELLEVVGTTAFFRRTPAPVFDPPADAWPEQRYNAAHFPVYPTRFTRWVSKVPSPARKAIKPLIPEALRRRLGG